MEFVSEADDIREPFQYVKLHVASIFAGVLLLFYNTLVAGSSASLTSAHSF
jgi:hypothetical protein